MKRQVLFIGYETILQEEIKEFLEELDCQAWFANTTEKSIRILDENPVETVILSLQKLGDAAILRYINLHFPGIKVLISANNEFEDIIEVLKKGKFSLLPEQLKLKELSSLI